MFESLESRLLFSAIPAVRVITADITVNAAAQSQYVWVPVTLSSAAATSVTVSYATLNLTAAAGTDYTATAGTLTFAAGQRLGGILVQVNGDVAGELDKAFDVVLTGATHAALLTAPAGVEYSRVAIRNTLSAATPAPWLRTTDAAANAGGLEVFNLTLSAPTTQPITLRYHTSDMTATSADYSPIDGILTFPAGATTAKIGVRTSTGSDTADSHFALVLSSPSNTSLANTVAYGTIVNYTTPSLSINNASAALIALSDTGETATFTVALSSPVARTVTVDYTTSGGNAPANNDYPVTSGTLTFNPGDTFKTIDVSVEADTVAPGETFNMVLSNPVNASIATTTGVGTINFAPAPALSIAPASALEVGGSITAPTMTYTVTLDSAAPYPVTVHYATSNGTAIAGTDYTATSGNLTFNAGDTSKTIDVTVTGESVSASETLNMTLSNPTNAAITTAVGVGSIDYAASAVLADNTGSASNGNTNVNAGIQMNAGNFTTGAGGAVVTSVTLPLKESGTSTSTLAIYGDIGGDPGSLIGTLTSPGSYSGSFAPATFTTSGITLSANSTYWAVWTVQSGNMSWSSTSDTTGTGSGFAGESLQSNNSGASWLAVWSDEHRNPLQMKVQAAVPTAGPNVSIAPTSVTEIVGDGTTPTMTYTVTLNSAATFPVTVHYATSDGTAIAGTDYTTTSGTLTFNPGDTSKTLNVTVTGDATASDETLTMTLSTPTNSTLTTATGTGTITYGGTDVSDNLAAPQAAGSDASNSDRTAASFTTGASSMVLSSVTIQLLMASPGTFSAMIYSDSSAHPGSLVGTLTSPGSYSSSAYAPTTFAGNGIVLNANSTYWVVMHANSGAFDVSDAHSGPLTGVGTGFTDVGLESSDSGSTWGTIIGGNYIPQMQVVAKPLVDLSDNLSGSLNGFFTLFTGRSFAASFSTGSSPVDLSSVSLMMESAGITVTPTVTINSDSSGQPGSIVGTLTSPTVSSSLFGIVTSTASGITLAANTTYWVVASGTSPNLQLQCTGDTTGTGAGFINAGVQYNMGSGWTLDSIDRLSMQILVS